MLVDCMLSWLTVQKISVGTSTVRRRIGDIVLNQMRQVHPTLLPRTMTDTDVTTNSDDMPNVVNSGRNGRQNAEPDEEKIEEIDEHARPIKDQ